MYHLLIVDNEPHIADSLAEWLSGLDTLKVEVYCSYSAREAMDLLERVRMDIVVADIRMPGVSGLEMAGAIMRRWPTCKIIFLTGYRDFEYAQEAIKQGGFDYLLKTDGDEAIESAIRKALDTIRQEEEHTGYIENARKQWRDALPSLRREFLYNILQGDDRSIRSRQTRFTELDIRLDPNEDVLLIFGQIDDWGADSKASDRTLYTFAIHNIVEEYIRPLARLAYAHHGERYIHWFVQPLSFSTQEDWRGCIRFVQGMLERAQVTVKQMLRLPVSFAIASRQCAWEQVADRREALNQLLLYSVRMDGSIVVKETKGRQEAGGLSSCNVGHGKRLRALDAAVHALEAGQEEEFAERFEELTQYLRSTAVPEMERVELFYRMCAALLTFAAMRGIPLEDTEFMRRNYGAIEYMIDALTPMGRTLLLKHSQEREASGRTVVHNIRKYVLEHMHEDISLVRLGEISGYNPSYLSRLYKLVTGESLSEFIAEAKVERAKALLREPTRKVGEVAVLLGFASEPSFYRLFKKATGLTPLEFREREAGEDDR